MKKINVLIVDDSSYMRNIIANILKEDSAIGNIATARNGVDALDKIKKSNPDVVTLDLVMPKMNGRETLSAIMRDCPTPTIIVSAFSKKDSEETLDALNHGAVDFIQKPSGMISMDMGSVADTLIKKVKYASTVNVDKIKIRKITPSRKKRLPKILGKDFKKIVVIASSTGGPPALSVIFSMLPKDIEACFLVVQHMPAGFTKSFADRLSSLGSLSVGEAQEGDQLIPYQAFVAPGGLHMEVATGKNKNRLIGIIKLSKKEPIYGLRPAADITMASVAKSFRDDAIGVVLTGMGNDGSEGSAKIKEYGGVTIAQDEESSIIFGMPKAAIDKGVIDKIIPLEKIAAEIERIVNK